MNVQKNSSSQSEKLRKLEQENRELQKKLSAYANSNILEERFRIERFFFSISSLFIGKYNLKKSIYQAFQLLGILSGADRVYLYHMSKKGNLVQVVHEYTNADSNLAGTNPASLSFDEQGWLIEQLQAEGFMYIEDTESLPKQAIQEISLFVSKGTKSLLLFPLMIKKNVEGFFGFDFIGKRRKWESNNIEAFKLATGFIGYAMEQAQYEKFMRKTVQVHEKIFEHTGAATLILKPDSTIVRANSEFEQMTGYKRKEVENKMKLLNLIDRKDCAILQKYLLLLISNPEAVPKHYEFSFLTADHELRYAYLTGSALVNTKTSIISFIDITEFKETERQLVFAKEKAEESERLKSAFFTNVSHEIRTPLNSITGFSSLISAPDLPTDKKEKYARQILNSSNELVNLIDNVLDISRIESGILKPKFTEFLVNVKLREMRDYFEDVIQQQGKNNLEILLNLPPGYENLVIRTDEYRFRQILTNLLENAVKFTSSGTIEFGYNCLVGPSDTNEIENILFFVRDTGIGIAKKDKERIFERFIKVVDKSDQLYRGAGLGLALCRDLIRMLSGEIWVESILGKGSTFYFTFPFTKPEQKEKWKKSIDTKKWDFTGKTIIIAEDTESNYLYLKEILAHLNITIIWAKNGLEAVEMYRKNKDNVALILMDILMPEYDGFEAAQRIRDIRKDLVIIAQTAFAFEGEVEHGLYAGCFNDYILKPFDIKTIRNLLVRYLSDEECE
jgi:PAS domain S-box-containing protein